MTYSPHFLLLPDYIAEAGKGYLKRPERSRSLEQDIVDLEEYSLMTGKAFYILFVAAVLLAVSWNFFADDAAKPVLMRLFVIALGLSLGCLAQQAISDKSVSLGTGRSLIRRETNPLRFWAIVALNYGLALFLVSIGLFVSA